MDGKFMCTEVTVDCVIGLYSVRLWIGTDGLASWTFAEQTAVFAVQALRDAVGSVHQARADDVVRLAREHVRELNAVQVRRVGGDFAVGVMAYTQPFEDNDAARWGYPALAPAV